MQPPRTDPLTAFQVQELQAAVRDMLDDADIRVQVTYKHFEGGGAATFDVQTGLQTRAESSDTNVNAVRRVVTVDEAERAGGTLQVGDRVYLIDQADLTAAPQKDDLVTEGGKDRSVMGWSEDPLSTVYQIVVRQL